jgi:hypothetical protein
MRRSLALWFAVSCIALAGGCAALVPKLEAPQLQLIGVTLEGGDAQQQQIRLALHVVNPNQRRFRQLLEHPSDEDLSPGAPFRAALPHRADA